MDNPVLEAARAKRDKHQATIDGIIDTAKAESRTLTEDEAGTVEDSIGKRNKQSATVEMLEAEDKRATEAAANAERKPEPLAAGEGVIRSEPQIYAEHNPETSYLRDLAAIQVPESGFDRRGAMERMERHAKEIRVDAERDPELATRLAEARFEMRVNPNTTAGTGGELVPPVWLVSQYVKFYRPGRVFADRIQHQPLPPGTDSINIPRITVGSLTGIQSANAAAVASQDIQTSSVAVPVNTIAGQEDISLQLLEQSPIAMDGVVFNDLAADYDQRLDLQVVSGTGSGGQHTGVFNVSLAAGLAPTINQASFVSSTSATFFGTAAGNFPSIVSAVNQVETLRFAAPTGIWVHPRRSNWWSTTADSITGRPLFIQSSYGPYNVPGLNEASPVPQGIAGELFGLPVVKDANFPTKLTAGQGSAGTQDGAVVLKEDDQILWEGQMKMRALPEVLSGTLQIRFQVYAYSALTFGRVPNSIAIVGGAGFAAPTF